VRKHITETAEKRKDEGERRTNAGPAAQARQNACNPTGKKIR